jgi:hypothetical protein
LPLRHSYITTSGEIPALSRAWLLKGHCQRSAEYECIKYLLAVVHARVIPNSHNPPILYPVTRRRCGQCQRTWMASCQGCQGMSARELLRQRRYSKLTSTTSQERRCGYTRCQFFSFYAEATGGRIVCLARVRWRISCGPLCKDVARVLLFNTGQGSRGGMPTGLTGLGVNRPCSCLGHRISPGSSGFSQRGVACVPSPWELVNLEHYFVPSI